jgi:hypothetical protein
MLYLGYYDKATNEANDIHYESNVNKQISSQKGKFKDDYLLSNEDDEEEEVKDCRTAPRTTSNNSASDSRKLIK